jgi:hypothetical protein
LTPGEKLADCSFITNACLGVTDAAEDELLIRELSEVAGLDNFDRHAIDWQRDSSVVSWYKVEILTGPF